MNVWEGLVCIMVDLLIFSLFLFFYKFQCVTFFTLTYNQISIQLKIVFVELPSVDNRTKSHAI